MGIHPDKSGLTSDKYRILPNSVCTASLRLKPFSVNPEISITTGPIKTATTLSQKRKVFFCRKET